jgi:hypothetical protein
MTTLLRNMMIPPSTTDRSHEVSSHRGRGHYRTPLFFSIRDFCRSECRSTVLVVFTDSKTWYGKVHPVQALWGYRQRMGILAKLIVVGLVSTGSPSRTRRTPECWT